MRAETLNLKRTAFILAVAWTVVIALGAGWHLSDHRGHRIPAPDASEE